MNEETNRSQRRQQYKHKAKHTKPKSNTKSSNDEEEVREGFLPPPINDNMSYNYNSQNKPGEHRSTSMY
jgi:hypothetical protein